jgi:hypothetical protein
LSNGVTYSAGDIIRLALKDSGVIGVGQTPNAEDSNDAFIRLNWMVDQWARKRWLIWHLIDLSVLSTGAQSYTVGPGGNINIAIRPDRLEAAFLRQINTLPNPIDYPLELISARETYNVIALKKLTSFPTWIFYDSAWPTGTIYPWPVPQANLYEVHISVKDVLNEFTNTSNPIVLPPEYFAALHTNLSVQLRDAYDLPPKPVLIGRAKIALNTLRQANSQVPRLQMPAGLVRPGVYNVFSDQVR